MIADSCLILVLAFASLFVIGIPIGICIVISSLSAILLLMPFDTAVFSASQKMVASLDSFSLIAVPFFIMSGIIMNNGGIAIKLINLAKLIGGRIPGYLAHTNIIGNMFFGSISGSAIAASTAIGGVLIPIEEKEGYDKNFAAAVNIASAPTGMLIPPSASFIIFSLISGGTSISALFLGGYVVGILWGLSVMIVAFIIAKKHKYSTTNTFTHSEVFTILKESIPVVLLIFIILGGILTGVFTAIEASAISTVYSIALAFFYYKSLTIKDLPGIFKQTFIMSGIIMFLITSSSVMSFAMAFTGMPQAISQFILGISDSKYVVLIIINLFLLFIGTFMDIAPAILIFTPIFMPIATELGVNPVHFGLILIYNLSIGTITPPVGTGLFVGASIAKTKVEAIIKPLIPFYIAIISILFLITFVEEIPLFLVKQ